MWAKTRINQKEDIKAGIQAFHCFLKKNLFVKDFNNAVLTNINPKNPNLNNLCVSFGEKSPSDHEYGKKNSLCLNNFVCVLYSRGNTFSCNAFNLNVLLWDILVESKWLRLEGLSDRLLYLFPSYCVSMDIFVLVLF